MQININNHSFCTLGSDKFLMFTIDEMANKLESQGISVVRMTLGKSELPLHGNILHAMDLAIKDPRKRELVFPSGLPQLKEAIASYYSKKYKTSIYPDEIIISTGTSCIFRNIFQLLLQNGDEVLLPRPYYPLYYVSAKILPGISIKYYDIDLKSLSVDILSFKQNFSNKTKIVVLNSPGNPLGNIITKDEIRELDKIVDGRALIISDEIYENVCFTKKSISLLEIGKLNSPYVVTNAFSKGYRMYSRRVGWCIIKENPHLINDLSILQEHTLLTADPVVQFAGISALAYQDEVDYLTKVYKNKCAYAVKKFNAITSLVKLYPASGGFYLTVDCHNFMKNNKFEIGLSLAKDIIEKIHVATVPGTDFGLPYTLRLSFTTDQFEYGIDALVNYFENFDRAK